MSSKQIKRILSPPPTTPPFMFAISANVCPPPFHFCTFMNYNIDTYWQFSFVLESVILGSVVNRDQSSSIAIDRDRTTKIRMLCVLRLLKVVRSRTVCTFSYHDKSICKVSKDQHKTYEESSELGSNKNNLVIISKPHLHLRTMTNAFAKFKKDQHTRYPLSND